MTDGREDVRDIEPDDVKGDWEMGLRLDTSNIKITYPLKITSVVDGAIEGSITGGGSISYGKCTKGIGHPEVCVMSFQLDIVGMTVFVAGALCGKPGDLDFEGHYIRIRPGGDRSEEVVLDDDPGDTGTAGGHQTTRRSDVRR